jgi:hypothetical protein
MASDSEVKDWLNSQGIAAPPRGPVAKAHRKLYDDAHQQTGDGEPGPDYPDGMDGADFDTSAAGPPPEPEDTPRPVATPGPLAKVVNLRNRKKTAGDKKRPGRPRPRVPVDDLIAGVWRGLAGFARPLPATSRLLRLQAPVAGAILEDTVKGTVVDKWLQPLARTTANGEAMFALFGPPLMVTALQLQPQSAPFILPVLRESLLIWCKISGPKMEAAMRREREFESEFGQDVDALIEMLFEGVFAEPGTAVEDQAG